MNLLRIIGATTALAASMIVGLASCSKEPAPPPAPPEPTLSIELDGKIGEMRELPKMPVARKHWGGDSSSQDEFVYEPPPGWIIYSFQTSEISKYGDSWYTPQLTSQNSNYAASTKFEEALSTLEKAAGEYNNYKAKKELEEIRKNSSSWSTTFQSANNILRIKWGGQSRKKKALGVTVDTDTASLNLDVTVTIARSLSKPELDLLVGVLKQKISRGESIASYFATPAAVPATAPAAAPADAPTTKT